MTTISPARGSSSTKYYHERELMKDDGRSLEPPGLWQGRLADHFGLPVYTQQMHYDRLADGQHPMTGEQLIRAQPSREYVTKNGAIKHTMERRSSYDITLSAPKSVSLTALVGGDVRVIEAHQKADMHAMAILEKSAQAHSTPGRVPEMTGNLVYASFQHTQARPVDGYAAPQLHTHHVVFNMTMTAEGEVRALEPREIFKQKEFATQVYRSELTRSLKELGYHVERGLHGPEIAGYSIEHLRAESPRTQQIEAAGGGRFATLTTRQDKDSGRDLASPHVGVAKEVVAQSYVQAHAQQLARIQASVHTAQTHGTTNKALAPPEKDRTEAHREETHQRPVRLPGGRGQVGGGVPNTHRRTPWAVTKPGQGGGMER